MLPPLKYPYIMYKAGTKIVFIVFFSVAIIAMIFAMSDRVDRSKNGFKRSFSALHPKVIMEISHTGFKCKSLAGVTNGNYYLSTDDPAKVLKIDKNFSHIFPLSFEAPFDHTLPPNKYFDMYVDTPYILYAVGNIPAVYRQTFTDSMKLYRKPKKFGRCAYDWQGSMFIRIFDETIHNVRILKYDISKGITTAQYLFPEKFTDGGLTTEGLLKYDRQSKKLVFTYYYCNKVIVLDNNLNVVTTFNTIDTFSAFQTSAIKVSNGYTYNKPKHALLRFFAASEGKIYVCSLIQSDNQNKKEFSSQSTIDVYENSSGKYLSTFYIPSYKNQRLYRFYIENSVLFAIYPNNTVIYAL